MRMRWAWLFACMSDKEMQRGGNNLEDLGVDGSVILVALKEM
jgi:hypothetical protein